MNKILDNLFYKEKLGIGNKTAFIKNNRERHPEIKVDDDRCANPRIFFRSFHAPHPSKIPPKLNIYTKI